MSQYKYLYFDRNVYIFRIGIANTTPTSAIISVYGDYEPIEVTGIGAGLNSEGVIHKANVIKKNLIISI